MGHDGQRTMADLLRVPQGRRAPIPERATIRQASATHIWVTELDPFDLASVVRYRVEGLP
jgi:hypothetical protein